MPIVEGRIRIDAQQEAVFDLAQDYGARLDWDPFLSRIVFRDGATEANVGVKVWVRAKNGLSMEVVYVTYDRPRSTAMKMIDGPRFFERFAGTWKFERLADGRTDVIFRYNFETRWRALRPALNPAISAVFGRDIRLRLEGLSERRNVASTGDEPMAGETFAAHDPGELYPRLVVGWASLPPAIRALHTIGQASGTFDVRVGANIFARMLAWLCRFPPARRGTPVLLRVTRDGRFQRWHRTIGAARMVSRQWDAENRLCEGFGLFECHFDVEGRDACLIFSQRTACIALGTFRIRIPAAVAPSIRAEVCSDGDGAHEYRARLPAGGLMGAGVFASGLRDVYAALGLRGGAYPWA